MVPAIMILQLPGWPMRRGVFRTFPKADPKMGAFLPSMVDWVQAAFGKVRCCTRRQSDIEWTRLEAG